MNLRDRLYAVDEAEELLYEAIAKMEEAVRGHSCEGNVRAYWIDQLKTHLPDHGFLCRNTTTESVRDMLEASRVEDEIDELNRELEECGNPEMIAELERRIESLYDRLP